MRHLHCITVIFLDQLDTLDACYEDIQSNCSLQLSDTQNSTVSFCLESATLLTAEIDECLNLNSTTKRCDCFSSINKNTTNLNNVVNCSLKEEMNLAKTVKKNCATGQFYQIYLLIKLLHRKKWNNFKFIYLRIFKM